MVMLPRIVTDKCPGCGCRFKTSPLWPNATAGELLATHLTGRAFCARDHYDLGRCIQHAEHCLVPETLHVVGSHPGGKRFGAESSSYEVRAVDKEGKLVTVEKCDCRADTQRIISKLKSSERVNTPRPTWRG